MTGPVLAARSLLALGSSAVPVTADLERVDLWRVADKTELPIVTDPPVATDDRVCARSTVLACEDPDLSGPGGTTHYYAVKGVCGLNEGP